MKNGRGKPTLLYSAPSQVLHSHTPDFDSRCVLQVHRGMRRSKGTMRIISVETVIAEETQITRVMNGCICILTYERREIPGPVGEGAVFRLHMCCVTCFIPLRCGEASGEAFPMDKQPALWQRLNHEDGLWRPHAQRYGEECVRTATHDLGRQKALGARRS